MDIFTIPLRSILWQKCNLKTTVYRGVRGKKLKAHIFQIVFLLSFTTTAFWAFSFLFDIFLDNNPSVVLSLFACVLLSVGLAFYFVNKKIMLVHEKASLRTVILSFLFALPISYFVLVPLVGFGAWFLVQMISPNAIQTNPEAGLFVSLMAVWFPLWPAPMLATFISWRYLAPKWKL